MKTFAQPKQDCELCEATGIFNAPNGEDDFTPELCDCVSYVAEQKTWTPNGEHLIRYEDETREGAIKRVLTDLYF